ncbi:MAG: methionyl-tRNA formyltransferase [Minisyncoccia bacterium]
MHNFVFFGTPYVARDTLAYLVARNFVPALVVSSPPAPQGRGMALTPSSTALYAKELGLPLVTPEKIDKNGIEEIRLYECDYAIVVAYGKILPEALIAAFPKGVLNVHYSLLPKYRGASPVEAALLHGERVTGVTIQKMVRELDAGDVLAAKEIAIDPGETTRELRPRLIQAGAELLVEILPGYLEGTRGAIPQDHSLATKCGKISKEEGLLDLSGDAHTNWNTYRAYAESPGTYFFYQKGEKKVRVKIKTAKYENGFFLPIRVVPEGKKETKYEEVLRG